MYDKFEDIPESVLAGYEKSTLQVYVDGVESMPFHIRDLSPDFLRSMYIVFEDCVENGNEVMQYYIVRGRLLPAILKVLGECLCPTGKNDAYIWGRRSANCALIDDEIFLKVHAIVIGDLDPPRSITTIFD